MSPTSSKKHAPLVRDAEATKGRILDAAEEEFARGGLLGARTEAIAAKTGVTKSMIFYHFGDKEGLYQAVLERAVSMRVATLQKTDLHNSDAEVALRNFVDSFLRDLSGNPNLPAIFFYEGIQNKGKFYSQIAITSLYAPLVDILKRGSESKQFRELDPLHAAVNIIGMCVFYFCSIDNVKHLWPAGTNPLCPEMIDMHRRMAVEQTVASVLAPCPE
ncbi:MAG: TetR/AcrR family transcriptional regulator [Cyanobacteria bacterium SZAS LIN-5]|nr:TetR/AcrR family transcriptional regulator [Cyanobacteria bacterium SZAS LIN-5]